MSEYPDTPEYCEAVQEAKEFAENELNSALDYDIGNAISNAATDLIPRIRYLMVCPEEKMSRSRLLFELAQLLKIATAISTILEHADGEGGITSD